MKEPCFYFDIDKQERDTVIRYLLGSLVRSRMDLEAAPSEEHEDEDVNVYLSHLLFAIALPEYHELAEPYLSTDSSDVLRWVQATEDRTIRYFIFKVNADYLLVHLAIFEDLAAQARHGIFRRSERHFAELGRLYYEQAANYHARIYRKRTGIGDVLEKLSRNFDLYSAVLRTVRRDYFSFLNRFRDQAFDKFMEEFGRYEQETTRQERIDRFLDLYAAWLRTKDHNLEQRIHDELGKLRQFDPAFGKGIFSDPKGP